MTVKQSRGRRWADRTLRLADVAHDGERAPRTPQPAPRNPHERNVERGLGPYESSYDISLGYGSGRSVILP